MASEKLTQLKVQKSKPGMRGDGGGLWLKTTDNGSRSWILRFRFAGKERWMGLGGFPDVGLREAREAAKVARNKVRQQINPLEERRSLRTSLQAEQAASQTFDQCVAQYIEAHRTGWKNAKHADQWLNTLTAYASPVIGSLPVDRVDLPHILKILEPIWTTKTETASRVRGRIESVLDWAKVRKLRTGENPACWKGHLDQLLPARSKVAKVEHHAALPYRDMPAFMTQLRQQLGTGARALEFAILTATRSGEVRGATWSEIDLETACWTIPQERMKAGREHLIPLSLPALALLKNLKKTRSADNDLVFASVKGGKALSNMTLTAVLKRMGLGDITAHGFRSSFRDWAGETTAFPREVIEHALAHQLKDKAEAAYQRGSLFEKRRGLMQSWANHCDSDKLAK